MSTSEYPRSAVVGLSTFVFVAFGVELYAMSVLLTEEAAGGEFSIALLSTAYGGAGVIAGLLAPRVGRWADHHSVRGLMAFGAVLAALGLLVIAGATSAWVVVGAFWLFLGPAQAMTLYEPAYVAVSLWVGEIYRNRAIALLSVIGGIAGPVFLPLTGFAVARFGWRPTVVGLAVAVLVTGLVATAFFYPTMKPKGDHGVEVPRVRWRRFRDDPRLGYISASVVLMFASMSTMLFHRVAVFEEQGFDVALVAVLAGVSGLLTFPGRWLAPRLASRVAPTTVFNWAIAGLVASMTLAIVGSPQIVMAAHFVFFGLFFGFSLPLRAVIMNDWYAGPDFGSVMGKQWSVAAVVGGFTPIVIGAARDGLQSYTWPLVALTIIVAFAGVLNQVAAARSAAATGAGSVRPGSPASSR